MDTLHPDIIITHILKFPFSRILFLTSHQYNILQNAYYEYLGCSDEGSKNFMHILMNMNNNIEQIRSTLYTLDSIDYDFGMIKFANEHLTIYMNEYLDLFIDFIQENCDTNRPNIRTQIILLMAYNSMEKDPSMHLITYLIEQLLSYEGNDPYCTYSSIYGDIESHIALTQFNIKMINIFYSMIGIKRVYCMSIENCDYYGCPDCGAYISDVPDNNELNIHTDNSTVPDNNEPHFFTCTCLCHCHEEYTMIDRRSFIITPQITSNPGNYFYYPSSKNI